MKTIERKTMEAQPISKDVLVEKYCKDGETTQEAVFKRVARGIAQAEKNAGLRKKWEKLFFDNFQKGAIGAGRIMAAAGTGIKATLVNCFVQPVGDSIQGVDESGAPGIYVALLQAAETMRRGGGVGYNFSAIRPKNSFVKGVQSEASGPCSYIDVFDASCKTVESAGSRRGAQMGILSITHPDIMEFVAAKRTKGRWNNFNVSIGVTNAFMEAVEADADWYLTHKAQPSKALIEAGAYQADNGDWVYQTIKAREIWDLVMKSTYDFAEPGIVFLDAMNKDNNLRYAETIAATNPCGEQPLPAYGCCDLGPIILSKFVQNPFTNEAKFDFITFGKVIATQVRFLDNVLDVTMWPLDEQKVESDSKRRVGVGFTALGNTLAMLGLRYDSDKGRHFAKMISEGMRNTAYLASVELAKEKGAFPLFDADKYLEDGTFASRLPKHIQDEIRKFGIRNSHLLSIAPTGTVSLAFADNASNGIEPPFALAYTRKKRMKDGTTSEYPVLDHALRVFLETECGDEIREPLLNAICEYKTSFTLNGVELYVKDELPESFVTALEMSAADHLAMLKVVQPYIDSAISKTVNIPADYPFEDFKDIYFQAWKAGLKGLATYRPNSTLGSVLSVGGEAPKPKEALSDVDPLKVVIGKRDEGSLSAVNQKIKYYHQGVGDKTFYLSVSFALVEGVIDGQKVCIERPIEVFIPSNQTDVPQEWITAFARGLSLSARSGLLAKALHDARQIKSDLGRVQFGSITKEDGSKVPLFHTSEVGAIAYAIQQILKMRGFLDADGNQVPTRKLIRSITVDEVATTTPSSANQATTNVVGKECPSCHAHTLVRRDGCEFCNSCGHTGSCG